MKCKNCGTDFNSEFCPHCGKRSDINSNLKDNKNAYILTTVLLFSLCIIAIILIICIVYDYNSNNPSSILDKLSQYANYNTSLNYNSDIEDTENYYDDSEDDYSEEDADDYEYEYDDESNDYYEIENMFQDKIEEYYNKYGSDTMVATYDIDGNGVDELIVSCGIDTSDWGNDVYDCSDGNISPVGSFPHNVSLYEADDGDGIYAVWRIQGYQEISQVTIDSKGRLNVKEIEQKQLPTADKGYQGTRIEFYRLGDYLGEKTGSYEEDDSNKTIEYYDMNTDVYTKNWKICVTDAYSTSDYYPQIRIECTITNTNSEDQRFIMNGNVQAYAYDKKYDGIGTRNNSIISAGETFDATLEFALSDLDIDDLHDTNVYLTIEKTNIMLNSLKE